MRKKHVNYALDKHERYYTEAATGARWGREGVVGVSSFRFFAFHASAVDVFHILSLEVWGWIVQRRIYL